MYLSTSSLIKPSYQMRATIYSKLFSLIKIPNIAYFLALRRPSLLKHNCNMIRTNQPFFTCGPNWTQVCSHKQYTTHISLRKTFFFSQQQLIAPFLNVMPLLQSLAKQGIKSKARAIKCCKEKITLPPKDWGNIPF